ncbi:MAG TPA: twin-arginine translocase subunit TatC [Opitutae bacterium]|nr:twin-arginine translocase subunit TatC [Coraliomargarita sp.]HBO58088.1 twin-arginine translocase subunit TatC [Opitutae bacterium]|tara:strand:- start:2600 stop:3439 length:840 start_codon:yes stop_codon:yes gene_type:complete
MNNPQDSNNPSDTYDSESDADTTAMSFLEHLEEFRWTVARSLIAFVLGVVVVVILLPNISGFLQMPLIHAYGSVEAVEQKLITYKPMGVFSVFVQIAFLGGLVLSMPFFLYFIACFIAPGLTDRERRVVRPACSAAFVLFLFGVCVAFFIILPLTLSVSVRFNQLMDFQVLLAASEYYNMVVWFSLATGAIFQFPLILTVLVFIQILRVEQLRRARRVVFVGMMIFSAFLTPGGDFLSLPLTTCILYALYELSIVVGIRIERKRSKADVATDKDEDDWM